MKLQSKILSSHFVILALVLILTGWTFFQNKANLENAHWVTHTYQVISEAHYIEKLLLDLETGQRGFLLTGEEHFLDPYYLAESKYKQRIRFLHDLVSDNLPQQIKIEEIERLIDKWNTSVAAVEIAERRKLGKTEFKWNDFSKFIRFEAGKTIVDNARKSLEEFIEVEEKLLAQRQKERESSSVVFIRIVLIGTIVIIIMGTLASYYSSYTINYYVGGEPGDIASVTEQIAKGDLDISVENPRGILKSVVIMAYAIKKQQEEIVQHKNKLENRVHARTKELKLSNDRLEQFAYAASHDLREPLRTISGFSEILSYKIDNLDDDAKKYFNFMKEAAVRMSTLIDDLLTYSRVGRVGELEEVDVNGVVSESMAGLLVLTEETGATIKVDPLPTVWANKMAMAHIFDNLINNAIKYRSKDAPIVEIKYEKLDDCWKFCVIDNGIGINPKYHEKIFGLFTRLGSRDESGTGAGLAIVKKSVEIHGGKLWVESSEGNGSKFCFTVPFKK